MKKLIQLAKKEENADRPDRRVALEIYGFILGLCQNRHVLRKGCGFAQEAIEGLKGLVQEITVNENQKNFKTHVAIAFLCNLLALRISKLFAIAAK